MDASSGSRATDPNMEVIEGSLILTGVKGLRDATRAGAGVYWDFATGKAKGGRKWYDRAPDDKRDQLCRDCTEEELKACRDATRIDNIQSAAEGSKPEVVIIIGPSGAGKSMKLLQAAEMFGINLANFAHVDGDDMRSAHGAWKTLVVDDAENGYLDAYDIYITNKGNKDLKKKYSKECLTAKKSVIFPWTNIEQAALDLIKEKGYTVYILGLLISRVESDCRQKNRAEINGRWADTPEKKWLVTMEDLSAMCQTSNSDKVLVFESTDVLNMRLVHARGVSGVEDPDDLERTIERLKGDMTL